MLCILYFAVSRVSSIFRPSVWGTSQAASRRSGEMLSVGPYCAAFKLSWRERNYTADFYFIVVRWLCAAAIPKKWTRFLCIHYIALFFSSPPWIIYTSDAWWCTFEFWVLHAYTLSWRRGNTLQFFRFNMGESPPSVHKSVIVFDTTSGELDVNFRLHLAAVECKNYSA